MKRLRLPASLFVLLCIQVVTGWAQGSDQTYSLNMESSDFYGREICQITVQGNLRSRDTTVKRIAHIKPGSILTYEIISQARINLEKSGLFSSVGIGAELCLSEDDTALDSPPVRIVLEVEDKWTLIPVPFLATDGKSFTGGVVCIETNILGTGKQVIAGIIGESHGFSGFAVYGDPALFQSRWKLSLSASAGSGEQEIAAPDGENALTYADDSLGASFGLGYQFSNQLSARLQARIEQHDLSKFEGPLSETVTDSRLTAEIGEAQQQLGLQLFYDATVPYGSLLKGFETSAQTSYFFIQKNYEVSGQALLYIPIFAAQRLRILASGGYGNLPIIAETKISGRDGFRSLPFGKVTADTYWSTAIGYDIPVFSAKWGAIVISSFYEHGWYRSSVIGEYSFSGPGTGIRFYLRKISLPALGIDVAYNLESEHTVFSVAVGMRM